VALTPQDISGIKAILAKSKAITSQLRTVNSEIQDLARLVKKVCYTAKTALTKSKLSQATNTNILSAQESKRKRSNKGKSQIRDARVLTTAELNALN
jgi:hypothetical protein